MEVLQQHQLNVLLSLSAICGIIVIFLIQSKYIPNPKRKILIKIAFTGMILLSADRYAYIYRGDLSTLGYWMVRICNYLVYASSLNIVYLFNEYLIGLKKDNKKDIPKLLIFTKYFLIVGELLIIVSQFFNWYYYFDTNNLYHRGTLFMLSYIFPLISLIIQLYVSVKSKKEISHRLYVPVVLFIFLPIIATIIQVFVYGLSLTNIVTVGAIVVLYISTIIDANYISKENNRIESELKLASDIQLNECPNIYPAFPNRKEFDLYANMTPAKEVGGDFYDYFLIDDDHLGIVIADVAGKGVPAALHMVKTKLLVKGTGLYVKDPAKVLELVNSGFLDSNKFDMFVTIWFGVIEISTGKLTFANAGHEDVIIYNPKIGFEAKKTKHNLPIGAFEDTKYVNYEIKMKKGDKLFLYTDGVIDAQNERKKQFGIDNLLKVLNENKDKNCTEIINSIGEKLNEYSNNCEQFDDITMLCFELYKKPKEESIIHLKGKFKADVSELKHILEYYTEAMSKIFDKERIKKHYIVVDEIFSNIAKYAYKDIYDDREKYVKIDVFIDKENRIVKAIFEDNGVQFNPLTIMTPDTSKSASDREVGGLGIFMVKKMMDTVSYEYKDNKNYLTIEKKY